MSTSQKLPIHPVDSDSTKRMAEDQGIVVESVVLSTSLLTRQRLDGYYIVLDPSDPSGTWMVNTSHVASPAEADSMPNALGMAQAAWDTCHTCEVPRGYCTALDPKDRTYDPYDQLDLYRERSLEAVVLDTYNVFCAGQVTELTDVTPLRYPALALDCVPPSNLTLRLSIGLNTSALMWTAGIDDLKLAQWVQTTPSAG